MIVCCERVREVVVLGCMQARGELQSVPTAVLWSKLQPSPAPTNNKNTQCREAQRTVPQDSSPLWARYAANLLERCTGGIERIVVRGGYGAFYA